MVSTTPKTLILTNINSSKIPLRRNTPPPTPEQILKAFTDAAAQKDSVDELKQVFAKTWKMLEGTDEQQKAQDVYNIRKDELEGAIA